MKADILRRVEELSDDEDDEGGDGDVVFVDDLEGSGAVRISGDGEESDENEDGEGQGEEEKVTLETILELAYIRDPKLFDRDAQTRRSRGRADLKVQTGEQTPWSLFCSFLRYSVRLGR
jgi:activating signal cointegrator complex subunit 2